MLKSQDIEYPIYEQVLYCLTGLKFKTAVNTDFQNHKCEKKDENKTYHPQIFKYYFMTEVPSFDDPRTACIPDDMKDYLWKISQKISKDIKKSNLFIGYSRLIELLESDLKTLIKLILRSQPKSTEDEVFFLRKMYYFLADYEFKNQYFRKAEKLYTRHLSYTPKDFDAWASLALCKQALLEDELKDSYVEAKHLETQYLITKINAIINSFIIACKLELSFKITIEFGSFAYNVRAYISRIWKKREPSNVIKEMEQKMIRYSKRAFEKFCHPTKDEEVDDEEEQWLAFYMLARVKEKAKEDICEICELYRKSAQYLHEQKPKYVKRINYAGTPPKLALEALELFYRSHATVVKFLLLFTEVETKVLQKVMFHLDVISSSSFVRTEEKSLTFFIDFE